MTPNIDFFWKSFEELSLDDLYAIINLRKLVEKHNVQLQIN